MSVVFADANTIKKGGIELMTPQPGMMLVVDDDSMNRTLLATSLQEAGHAVEVAEDGVQALEALRTQPFDVVLLDLVMPKMDGFQVLEQMKADSTLQHIPVIVVSAQDEMESVVRCIEMGATDHLAKPVEPILLYARIKASLAEKRRHDQEREYFRNVTLLTEAANAVEAGTFDPVSLEEVAARPDALGLLARMFQHMAKEVYARQQSLKQEVQELRDAIEYLRSEEYMNKLQKKNYSEFRFSDLKWLTGLPQNALSLRADDLIGHAERCLKAFCGETGNIIIPFSGGRDSTLLALLTKKTFPNRNIILVTALHGFGKHSENVGMQVEMINELIEGTPVTHTFLDLSDIFRQFVIEPAIEDKEFLGFPGICSACKIVMEVFVAHAVAKTYTAPGQVSHILWGYVESQAELLWTEQTEAFRKCLDNYLKNTSFYPNLHIGAPLSECFHYLVDTVLVLGKLGIPVEDHKHEGQCGARGLNPAKLEVDVLKRFIEAKLKKIPENGQWRFIEHSEQIQCPLSEKLREVLAVPGFKVGAYNEEEGQPYM